MPHDFWVYKLPSEGGGSYQSRLARLLWHTCSFLLTCYASHTKFLTVSAEEVL